MGRQKQPQIADRLLDACTDVALAHGLPDRLGPFVRGTGTSSRMLIYHFGTRDALLRAVLGRARERQRELFGDLLRPCEGEPYPTTLRRAWADMTGERGRPFLMMFGRLREDAEQQLWPGFRQTATTDWLDPLAAGLATLDRADQATLVLAVIRGLIMDLEATGDAARVDRAFDALVDTLAGPGGVGDKRALPGRRRAPPPPSRTGSPGGVGLSVGCVRFERTIRFDAADRP